MMTGPKIHLWLCHSYLPPSSCLSFKFWIPCLFLSLVWFHGQLPMSLWISDTSLICCAAHRDAALQTLSFLLCVAVWPVGLCWPHPAKYFRLYQIRKLQANNNDLLSSRFISMLMFSWRKQPWYNRCTLFPCYLYFLLLITKLPSSFYPLWNSTFFPQQDRNSDAITSTVHVSTGRHKLPRTQRYTVMWKHTGRNMQEAIYSAASSKFPQLKTFRVMFSLNTAVLCLLHLWYCWDVGLFYITNHRHNLHRLCSS